MRHLGRAIAFILVAITGAATLWVSPAAADPSAEAGFLAKLNVLRTGRGLAPLGVRADLTDLARSWSRQMVSANDISHNPNLAAQAPGDWQRIGENVGMGGTVEAIHNAFVASPKHLSQMVDGGYNSVGVGVVRSGNGTIFVTVNFMTAATGGILPDGFSAATRCTTCVAGSRSGYWMIGSDGKVFAFGDAPHVGDRGSSAVDIEPTRDSSGYWSVNHLGQVTTHGASAPHLGNVVTGQLQSGEEATSLSSTPSGNGYWVFTTKGRSFAFGDARHFGDMAGRPLNGPVLDSIATPTGNGYYMVGSDGGIFAFGDAKFFGSMGGNKLNAPVQSLVPDGDGAGYWLVASDGGLFAFEAPFRGSMGGRPLNRPVTGMVPYGNGYLMVGTDGGIFNFSDKAFHGSLGASPPANPIVAVAALRV